MENNTITVKIFSGVVLSSVLIVLVGFLFFTGSSPYSVEALDTFASCLSTKGFTMYGAYWCPHCQNERAAFGDSFEKVSYVECTGDPQQCTDAGITGYPTWLGPDSVRLEGEQGLKRLSDVSRCSLYSEQSSQ